jgi:hypothetical protein
MVSEPYFRDDADYTAHAANYHARLADIVRRLQDHQDYENIVKIIADASALWDEMKGGGDE